MMSLHPWSESPPRYEDPDGQETTTGSLSTGEAVFGVLDAVGGLVAVLSPDGRIQYLNTVCRVATGCTLEQARGLHIRDFLLLGMDRACVQDLLAGQARTGEQRRFETRWRTRSGEHRWIEWEYRVLRDTDGSAQWIVLTGTDLRDRKRAEHERLLLDEAGQVLASSLDHEQTLGALAHLVVAHLADVCILDVFEDSGYLRLRAEHAGPGTRDRMIRLSSARLPRTRPVLTASVIESRRPLLVNNRDPGYLAAAIEDDEDRRLVEEMAPRSLLAVPLIARERCLGVLVLLSVRGQRTFDEQSLALAEEIGRHAAVAVDNARLYHEARCATRAREDLLSVVAHDLRGPLNAIHLSALVLERRMSDPRLTDRIHDSVRCMERLIRDLLDISSLEAGHMQIEPAPVSVVEILSDVLDTARPQAAQRGVEFRLDVPRDTIVVHADRERIRQVLANLVDNALKFTPQDGHIRLGARPHDGEVIVLVEDTGTGIEHTELPRIFERFRHRRRAPGSGTGLGLAICRGIVEAHGGRIWACNREVGGAAFAFTLPACAHAG